MRTLYHLWLSPASRRVRLVLGEKHLDFDMKIEKTWERRPEFLAMNPTGEVPVLVGERLLDDWEVEVGKFWQVCPKEMIDRLDHPLSDDTQAARA